MSIRVSNLGKEYFLGSSGPQRSFREAINATLSAPFKHFKKRSDNELESEHFWALKNVSFDIQSGEVVGIIGRNGAGKSTLLKILSRITEPTTGRIEINGRVGSLLEVGTGFHSELTGRENVFLNGAILGMTRQEIRERFDEIVAFAELDRFLDTPVKRYSSGMYMRLAFAVAAHLEPEILLVDEVLAVGDVEFQKKCIGKMSEIADEGRTVVFVSHNMAAVRRLCGRCILIENGEISCTGTPDKVIEQYLSSPQNVDGKRFFDANDDDKIPAEARVVSVKIIANNKTSSIVAADKKFTIEIEFEVLENMPYCRTGFCIRTSEGIQLFETFDAEQPEYQGKMKPGFYKSSASVPAGFLRVGHHSIDIILGIPNVKNIVNFTSALSFQVEDQSWIDNHFGVTTRGIIRPPVTWIREEICEEQKKI